MAVIQFSYMKNVWLDFLAKTTFFSKNKLWCNIYIAGIVQTAFFVDNTLSVYDLSRGGSRVFFEGGGGGADFQKKIQKFLSTFFFRSTKLIFWALPKLKSAGEMKV